MELGCPVLGDRLSAGFADIMQHSPSFWKRHSQAQFCFQLSGWRRGRSWRQKIYYPGLIIGVKGIIISRRARRLPAIKGAHVLCGRRYRRRFWRLRWLRAIIVIIGILCMIYHGHCCQDVKWIGRQVEVVQARLNDRELPSKTKLYCWLVGVVIAGQDLGFLGFDRRNWWHCRCMSVPYEWATSCRTIIRTCNWL